MDAEQQTTEGVALRVQRADGHVDIRLVGDLDDASDASVDATLALIAEVVAEGPQPLRLVADHPADRLHPLPEAAADRLGLGAVRDVLQLRVALPIPTRHPERARAPRVSLRPFAPGHDAEAWVEQNNRAFAWHPDQAGRTVDGLRDQLAEAWVDLDGFLVLDDPEHPGRLAGSCWTRVHLALAPDPALGEIFVIGVDPDHHGKGLGTALVLAGLDHLADRELRVGMLYVEADNAAARRLYERLGFALHRRRRIRS